MKSGDKAWIVEGFNVFEYFIRDLDDESVVLDIGQNGLSFPRSEVFESERDAYVELSKQAYYEAELHRTMMNRYFEMSLKSIEHCNRLLGGIASKGE